MTCPRCKAPFTRLIESHKVSSKVNEFGRVELTVEATYEEPVTWEGNHYHCHECGYNFSFKQHTLQDMQPDMPKCTPKPMQRQLLL